MGILAVYNSAVCQLWDACDLTEIARDLFWKKRRRRSEIFLEMLVLIWLLANLISWNGFENYLIFHFDWMGFPLMVKAFEFACRCVLIWSTAIFRWNHGETY